MTRYYYNCAFNNAPPRLPHFRPVKARDLHTDLHTEEQSEDVPLYYNPVGLRLAVHKSDVFMRQNVVIDIEEVCDVMSPPVAAFDGQLYRLLHTTTLQTAAFNGSTYNGPDAMLLQLLANGQIERTSAVSRYLLNLCLIRDPGAREPIRKAYPWYWRTFKDHIKREALAYRFNQTMWTILAACPDVDLGDDTPSIKEAAELGGYAHAIQHLELAVEELQHHIRRLHKHVPGPYHRILEKTAAAITEELRGFRRADLGAEMLAKVQESNSP